MGATDEEKALFRQQAKRRGTNSTTLPPTLSETIFSKMSDYLPEWVAGPFRDPQRRLIAMERRLQRRFINEYKAQVRALEPALKERGLVLGRTILQAFLEQTTIPIAMTYSDADSSARSGSKAAFFQQGNVREVLQALDPLITPVLDPFVEGLKQPINEALGGVVIDVKRAMFVTAATSLLTGIVVGALLSRTPRRP